MSLNRFLNKFCTRAALSDLTGFGLLVSPGREDVEPAKFEAAVALAAEHFLNLYEQKVNTIFFYLIKKWLEHKISGFGVQCILSSCR